MDEGGEDGNIIFRAAPDAAAAAENKIIMIWIL